MVVVSCYVSNLFRLCFTFLGLVLSSVALSSITGLVFLRVMVVFVEYVITNKDMDMNLSRATISILKTLQK